MRKSVHEALETVNMSQASSIPVEMEKIWASAKNKESLQILSRELFVTKAKERSLDCVEWLRY